MADISSIQRANYDKTENGTPVIEPGKEMGKDVFMKLLVAQMTNQDPFNPQDPTQYVTQLAQFSMLEQTMSLNDSMEYLVGLNSGMLVNTAVSTASALIGKEVELYAKDEKGDYKEYSGEVKGVSIKDGVVYLEVKLDNSEEIKKFEYSTLVKVKANKEVEDK